MGASSYEVRVVGELVVVGGTTSRPAGVEARLLALLAIRARAVQRSVVAGTLWADATEERASGCLRSALWRVGRHLPDLVTSHHGRVTLAPTTRVDLAAARARARAVVDDEAVALTAATADFERDLLPDLHDEWLVPDQERFRQLRLCALEAIARANARHDRWAQALDAVTTAIVGEPLRASAHRLLVDIHVAAGNEHEAERARRVFARLGAAEGAVPHRGPDGPHRVAQLA